MKLLAMVLLAAACGSRAPTTTSPSTGDATAALPDVPFGDLDYDQRVVFMKQRVVPTMKPLFLNHDAAKYAEFGCPTCHGDSARAGDYEMPNPKLPRLDLENLGKHEAEYVEWMSREILPAMARLVREPMYSEANPDGFSCLRCHTEEGAQDGAHGGHGS
jgi:cytochrome c553